MLFVCHFFRVTRLLGIEFRAFLFLDTLFIVKPNSLACICLLILVVIGTAGLGFAQGTMHRPIPTSDTTDSSGNRKAEESPRAKDTTVYGTVVLADGSVPQVVVQIYLDCGGSRNVIAITDSKGRFSFNPRVLDSLESGKQCFLFASLDGYRSERKGLPALKQKSGMQLGKMVLQPLSGNANGLISATEGEASKAARKMYEKALDEAGKQEWLNATASLQKAVAEFPSYSSAWLALGILQQNRGDRTQAEKSFLQSARADPKFALPWIRVAALEGTRGDWGAARDHSQKAIDLNPEAFPNAYALNAIANVNLQNIDAAQRSAEEGLKLDTNHEFPELEYALGMVLFSKDDLKAAAKHLQAYVDEAKNGPNAAAAQSELSEIQSNAARKESASASRNQGVQAPQRPTSAADPMVSLLQNRNAPLLVRTPAHTCLESISQTEIDTRGKPHTPDVTRVEIAVSDEGKEMYGRGGGKHFSNASLADMLHYTFSNTGIFSSIARALIAGNGVQIESAGEETVNGESVKRYNFHLLPGVAGWSIQYGKESGEAREEGWFLVDSTSTILRRVVVHAIDIPHNLKLNKLEAVVDYEPETIADRQVLLPYEAEVHVEEKSGKQRVSRMFFDHCRAFAAESVLTFNADTSEAQSDRASGTPELPPGIDVTVSLLSPVSPASAAANDVLKATVARPVVLNGHEIIARGAIVEGHVHPRPGENTVVVELDRVQTRRGWASFYARLVSIASTTQANPAKSDPEIPGVAKLNFVGKSAELATGTQMVWKTEQLIAPTDAHAPQLNTSVAMQ